MLENKTVPKYFVKALLKVIKPIMKSKYLKIY